MKNREPKYRVWNKSKRIMVYPNELKQKTAIENTGCLFLTIAPNIDNFELMQYSGRKDREGIEIYEKDIVDISTFKGDAIYRVVIEDIMNMPEEFCGSNVDWYEVVGNTIENVNLMMED